MVRDGHPSTPKTVSVRSTHTQVCRLLPSQRFLKLPREMSLEQRLALARQEASDDDSEDAVPDGPLGYDESFGGLDTCALRLFQEEALAPGGLSSDDEDDHSAGVTVGSGVWRHNLEAFLKRGTAAILGLLAVPWRLARGWCTAARAGHEDDASFPDVMRSA